MRFWSEKDSFSPWAGSTGIYMVPEEGNIGNIYVVPEEGNIGNICVVPEEGGPAAGGEALRIRRGSAAAC